MLFEMNFNKGEGNNRKTAEQQKTKKAQPLAIVGRKNNPEAGASCVKATCMHNK